MYKDTDGNAFFLLERRNNDTKKRKKKKTHKRNGILRWNDDKRRAQGRIKMLYRRRLSY